VIVIVIDWERADRESLTREFLGDEWSSLLVVSGLEMRERLLGSFAQFFLFVFS
jgi:hypothetical protein